MRLYKARAGRRGAGALFSGLSLLGLLAAASSGQTIVVVDEHPRLVFRAIGTPDARTFQTIRDLYNANGGNNPFRSEVYSWLVGGDSSAGPVADASRYVITGDRAYAQKALDAMYGGSLSYGGTEGAEVGIQWALAYDWIHDAWQGVTPPPNLSTKLANIEGKIATFTSSALADLDSSGPSLWHGRAALGAVAWVTALALPTGNGTYDSYRSRAFNHWQQTLKATHACGAWPEGPTYWATSRAINFPLAYQSYVSAVASAPSLAVANPLEDLRQLGLWQAYTERGDGSFNRYGDVSSQVQISNGTIGRALDYYAQATNDPALAAFAEHARQYRDPNPLYHSEYRWFYPISYDPNIPKPAGYNPSDPGACLADALPNAAVFGRDSVGLVVMRQGWSAGETQVSFKAGDYLAHHGHYDQGTFTIFKYDKLVINSGGYGPYTGDHRLNYYVRTVSTNSILVQRPGETWNNPGVAPPTGWANDGGQRLVQPTGSMVTSYENWQANKTSGWNYESGNITAFDNADGDFTYVASDLTRAYNSTLYDSQGRGGKVSQVTRQLVYLQDDDVLVVFDRVASTDPAYRKKWLLHTPNKFSGGTETVVRGTGTDGIMVVDGATIPNGVMTMTNGMGKLFLQTLLPASYTVNKVGGTNYRYYVEDDGNDADGYDGTNHDDYTESPWHDYGNWRIEISPATPATFDVFLNVLSPRSVGTSTVNLASLLSADATATVLCVGTRVVGFGTSGLVAGSLMYDVPGGGTYRHLLVDMVPDALYAVGNGADRLYLAANAEGVLRFAESAAGARTVVVAPLPGPGIPGDANLDGTVDFADYQAVEANFGSGLTWAQGDFDLDGDVDFADYQVLETNYGMSLLLTESVPEPAALALLLAGCSLLRRRR